MNQHSSHSSDHILDCNFGHSATDLDSGSSRTLDCTAVNRTIADHILGYTAVDHTAVDHTAADRITIDRIADSDHSIATVGSGRTLGYHTTSSPNCRRSVYREPRSWQSGFHSHRIHHS